MSWDCTLSRPDGSEALLPDNMRVRGGTFAVGVRGNEAWLNVTYNYGIFFRRVLHEDGLGWLAGKTAVATIPLLRLAAESLNGEPDKDYWKPTEGNAKKALQDLLAMAQAVPGDCVWTVC